jgi:hypothetical protein
MTASITDWLTGTSGHGWIATASASVASPSAGQFAEIHDAYDRRIIDGVDSAVELPFSSNEPSSLVPLTIDIAESCC